jgi:predicted nucleic acid-binding protein
LNGDPGINEKVQEYLSMHDRLTLSDITYFEILAGLEFKEANKQIEAFELFVSKCRLLHLTSDSIRISAKIYGDLRRKGIQIGTPDLLIAGIAIEHSFQLITNNEKHYQPISQLSVDNWKK